MAEMTVKEKETRFHLAFQAVCELDFCNKLLLQELPTDSEFAGLKALSIRIGALQSVILSVLSDDTGHDTKDMQDLIDGELA